MTEDLCKKFKYIVERLFNLTTVFERNRIELGSGYALKVDTPNLFQYKPMYSEFVIQDEDKDDLSIGSISHNGRRSYMCYISFDYVEVSPDAANKAIVILAEKIQEPMESIGERDYRNMYDESYFQGLLTFPSTEENYNYFVLSEYVLPSLPPTSSIVYDKMFLTPDNIEKIYKVLRDYS